MGELMKTLKAGFNPKKIVFSGVGKTFEELNYAVNKKIFLINAESKSEITEIEKIAKSKKRIIDIIKKLTESDVVACISGCTEIELLVKQTDIPKVKLLPSAQIHIQYITDLLLGRIDLSKIEP